MMDHNRWTRSLKYLTIRQSEMDLFSVIINHRSVGVKQVFYYNRSSDSKRWTITSNRQTWSLAEGTFTLKQRSSAFRISWTTKYILFIYINDMSEQISNLPITVSMSHSRFNFAIDLYLDMHGLIFEKSTWLLVI